MTATVSTATVPGPADADELAADELTSAEYPEPDGVRYCPRLPVVFDRGRGAELRSADGRLFVDLFAGGGVLNYGHNNLFIKRRVLDHLSRDEIVPCPGRRTTAEWDFLHTFQDIVLRPRDLELTVRLSGPTRADAVGAAVELARAATGRRRVIALTGADHGIAGDSVALVERLITADSGGLPAAIVVEPMWVAGNVHQAPAAWLRAVADRYGVLLVLDESRTGCGRTGTFFRFEQFGVRPDFVVMSMSTGGYGPPLPMVLCRPDLDLWPGAHDTIGRGPDQLALVAATAACELWTEPKFLTDVVVATRRLDRFRTELAGVDHAVAVRGRGMLLAIDLGDARRANRLRRFAFDHEVIVGVGGRTDEVVLVTPPLCIDIARLERGIDVLRRGLPAV